MNKIPPFMIFSMAFLMSAVYSDNPKQDCILAELVEYFDLQSEQLEALQRHVKIMDFEADLDLSGDNLVEQLDLLDGSTYSDLQTLLVSSDFASFTEPLIKKCDLNVARTKRRCEKHFGKDNCVALAPFVYGKKCEPGFSPVGVGFCVPHCPVGFERVEEDPFLCEKLGRIQRSRDLVDEEPEGRSKYSFHRNIRYLSCPDGYSSWGFDFCIQNCPLGFVNLGNFCQKPLVQRRKFELFYYDVSVDDFLVIGTHEVQY